METITFACNVTNNSDFEDLALEFWVDNNKFFDNNIKKGSTPIQYVFNEDDNDHVLKIIFKNKTDKHTVIDPNGNILSDALIDINGISFDNVEIDQLFFEHATYTHDFNGTKELTKTKFYGSMGCNGTLELNFTTPFYMWLLEHM